jgi:arylsulfatase A-like enzyme
VCPAPGGGPANDFRGYDWFTDNTPDVAANGTSSTELIAAAAEAYIAAHAVRGAAGAAAAAGGAAHAEGGAAAGEGGATNAAGGAAAAAAAAAAAPFFLYLPFQNIHAPYDCTYASFARFLPLDMPDAQRVIFGYLYELDAAVARVVAALAAAGLADDTIIVFVSDNGAPPAPNVTGRNYPLSGFKSQTYEGGTRVPAFVHAPGRLQPRTVDALVHVTDWVPTLVAAAGGAVGSGLDGLDVWPTLAGGAPVRSEVLVNVNPLCGPGGGQFGSPTAALRVGDLKLLCFCYEVAGVAGGNATGCRPDPAAPGAWPRLYNVSADPGETTDLAAAMPAAVAALEARLAELAAASVEPMQWTAPYQGKDYECAACPRHPPADGDPYAPWQAWL